MATDDGHRVSDPVARHLERCTATCQLWPEQEEGPYRRGDQPERRDIADGRPGTPLTVGLLLRTDRGGALDGAEIEVWHCDALGRYSGYPPPALDTVVTADTAPQAEHLPEESFLRGSQPADAAGRVEFRTIHPGWYPGRTVHIHVAVRVGSTRYTSQLYFPQQRTTAVLALPPYRQHGAPDTTNDTDEIFPTGGAPAVLDIVDDGDGRLLAGLCMIVPDAPPDQSNI